VLAEELWPAAARIQEERMEHDPWTDLLATVETMGERVGGFMRVSTQLALAHLDIPAAQQQQYHMKRLGHIMKKLGWSGPKSVKLRDGSVVRGYERPIPPKNKGEADETEETDEPPRW
jgi:hypothetical protein